MSCENCGSNGEDGGKSCGNCSSGGGCGGSSYGGRLAVFDWLGNMQIPNGQQAFDCVEVRFKNNRKQFFRNTEKLPLTVGEVVAVEAQSGHDVGVVMLTGELVRIQMKRKKVRDNSEEVRKIYRKANEKDIETWHKYREKEHETMIKARKISKELGLEMKISDVEYQGDGTKATFYYTAEGRVDFRELIKKYAASFGIRIEMKQIGYRQEAALIGGLSSSGRELCCSSWMTDFRSVSTSAARYQQLSINPQKLTGHCGKLKCCLNFELDAYLEALEDFPSMETVLNTEKGKANCVKIDVFKKQMWFSYEQEVMVWSKLSTSQVKEIMAMNKGGKKSPPLEEFVDDTPEPEKDFVDVIEENSLERFERKKKRRYRKKPSGRNKPDRKGAKGERKPQEKKEGRQNTRSEKGKERKNYKKKNKKHTPGKKKDDNN